MKSVSNLPGRFAIAPHGDETLQATPNQLTESRHLGTAIPTFILTINLKPSRLNHHRSIVIDGYEMRSGFVVVKVLKDTKCFCILCAKCCYPTYE